MTPPLAGPTATARRLAVIWALFAAAFCLHRWPYIAALRQADPDDTLRLVQVRDLLAGQGWFDLVQHRINPPAGVTMHWSRIVDAPLALTELVLRPLVGALAAEQAATVIVPLATFAALIALTALLVRRLIDPALAPLAAVLLATAFPVVNQILPTRVDHHGWQIVAALVAALGLTHRDPRRGGVIAGAAMAVGLAISLELLPLAALLGTILALDWLRDPRGGARFTGFMLALAGGSLIAFALTRGPDLANYCDAVSPVYLAALGVAAAGSGLTARFAGASRLGIAGGLAASAAAAALTIPALAPACLQGPFAALGPLLRLVWLDNVVEGLPVWHLDLAALAQWTIPPLAGLAASTLLWRQAAGEERWHRARYALLLAGAIVLGVVVLRSMAVAMALAVPPLAWLVSQVIRYRPDGSTASAKVLAVAGQVLVLIAILMPALPAQMLAGAFAAPAAEAPVQTSTADRQLVAARLRQLPQGTVLSTLDDGPWILLGTPHSVVATGHHRGAAAMHDLMVALFVDPPVARTILARHGVDYVVLPLQSAELRQYRAIHPDGLAGALAAGRIPPWLVPLDLPRGSGMIAFAVRPA